MTKGAPPMSPRPDEPGLYAVVEDVDGHHWCRIDTSGGFDWFLVGIPMTSTTYRYNLWCCINPVRILCEGAA